MPYKSDKQRKFLHSQKPAVAAKFDRDISMKALKGATYRPQKKARC